MELKLTSYQFSAIDGFNVYSPSFSKSFFEDKKCEILTSLNITKYNFTKNYLLIMLSIYVGCWSREEKSTKMGKTLQTLGTSKLVDVPVPLTESYRCIDNIVDALQQTILGQNSLISFDFYL